MKKDRRLSMWERYKKRFIAFVCIVCMLCSVVSNGSLVRAEEENSDEAITLATAPESEFAHWTFSDVNIPDGSFGNRWGDTEIHTTGKSLDKTLFQGKIKFPSVQSEFIIGEREDGGSKYRGFRFISNGTNLSLAFSGTSGNYYNETGNTGGAATSGLLATFDPAIAGTTLIGNENLEVAVSVEYTSVSDGVVTMKVGVFFNGSLYNNTYFTVKDAPEAYLKQTIRFQNSDTSVKWYAESINITLENAPEKDYECWTFSDMGMDDQTLSSNLNWGDDFKDYIIGNSLDQTIFNGKINFTAEASHFGNFYIGGSSATDNSKWRGFVFLAGSSTDKLLFGFVGTGGRYFNANGDTGSTTGNASDAIAVFDPEIAGATLRGNSELRVSLSVKYMETTDTTATVKVGVFFNGKLYDNTYYTVKDVPLEYLNQNIRFNVNGLTSNAIASSHMEQCSKGNITLENAPEKDYACWTFSDMGMDDQTLSTNLNWGDDFKDHIIGNSLDQTIFNGKINFTDEATHFGNFYIGGSSATDSSKWRGFVFLAGSSTDKLLFGFVGTGGRYFNANGDTGSTAGNASDAIAVFEPGKAGTTLRGNSELRVSLSVEYLETTDTAATVKVGVFFNGKLYDNTYYTVKDVPLEYLNQNIRFNVAGLTSNAIASSHMEQCNQDRESITLETAPEKDYACWTFSDMGMEDQTLDSNLNWGDDFKDRIIGDSLDQTIFNGKINFTDEATHFGNFYIGGSSATDSSKWRGFVFLSGSSTDKLLFGFVGTGGRYFNANGDTGSDAANAANAIAVFEPGKAGTTLRGNSELRVSLSVEYLETTDTTATLKVGVFFDGVLYNNTYYTVKDVPLEYLNQNVRFNVAGLTSNAIASSHMEQCSQEKITLDNAPEKDFACWTFSDLGIEDQRLWGNLNFGESFKEQTIGTSLDKTIFNGKINFDADTKHFGNFYIGGAAANDASKWRGFVFLSGNTTDKLYLYFMGRDGIVYNANGNTGESNNSTNAIAVFNSALAGTTLRGNSDLQVSFSVEYTEVTATTANLKVGVFFDGILYNNTYYTVKDVPLEYLNQNVRFYVASENNVIASQHLCGKVDKEVSVTINSTYEELTVHDFSIYDTKVESFAEGAKEFRVENFCDLSSLNGTAFSAICNFPEGKVARFSLGGSFWRGVSFASTKDGRIEVFYVNTAGDTRVITRLSAETAGVDSLVGKDITLRVTFDITDQGNGKSNMRMGIYVNGTLYDGTHYTVSNIDSETMTRTMKVYLTEVPFEIKSVPTDVDLSIYGFDNKTWKEKI